VKGRRWRGRLASLTWVLPFLGLLVIWQIVSVVVEPRAAVLPKLPSVWNTATNLVADGRLLANILASLERLLLGTAVGIVTGVTAGVLAGLNKRVATFFNPLVVFFSALSGIVWLPLALAWLGIGRPMVIFIIWNSVFFLVFSNTLLGVQLVPVVLENGVKTLGAGRWRTIWQVTLPGAMPHIIAGIRAGFGFGWRALIAAELIGAASGLGQMIYAAANFHRSDIIIVGAVTIGIIGVAMDRWLLATLERRTIERWGMV
jgi:NitT/TauT family transport system permease protein/taurine transport system permease protein